MKNALVCLFLVAPLAIAHAAGTTADAKKAYTAKDYKNAAAIAKPLAPTDAEANRVFGAASCYLKDEKSAKAAYARADGQAQQFLRFACQQNGIKLDE